MIGNPCDISSWTLEGSRISKSDGVRYEVCDNRDCRGRPACCSRRRSAIRCDDRNAQLDKLFGESRKPVQVPLSKTGFKYQIRTFDVAKPGKSFFQKLYVPVFLTRPAIEESTHPVNLRGLLRVSRHSDNCRQCKCRRHQSLH